MSDQTTQVAAASRTELVRRVVEGAIVRRSRGESLPDEALCEQHAELLPELATELRKLRLIEQAREQSQQPAADSVTDAETAAYVPGDGQTPRLSRSLSIRCPLCHEPLQIAADQPLDDIACSACRRRFSLAGDDPALKLQPVARIARFELLSRLGMGGFGTVWKARDTELDRTVALKIPRQRHSSAGEDEQFLYEARVAAKLRHPFIVTVHEIGHEGEHAYIVSDLVEGQSLDKLNRSRRLTQRETAELLASVCDALHFAHEAGIVHRDLKPGNILIDADLQPHITDFGLAKRTQEVEITTQGEILGTPAYMSPEQARGEAHLADRRTDIYAVGVMLFELLTDDLPFRGNMVMLMHHAANTEPTSPRNLNRSVPRDLETICLKCLEKDPARRYPTAAALATELRRFLAGDEILARPITRPERLWRWCRRNPRIPALSAALLVVVLIAYALAWRWFDNWLERTEGALRTQASETLKITADAISDNAGRDLDARYAEVAAAAGDTQLIGSLQAYAPVHAMYAPLNDLASTAPEREPLMKQLLAEKLREGLQDWIEEQPLDDSRFAWFVMLPDGLQIARHPEKIDQAEHTIGRNYSWRAYFHGGLRDASRDSREFAGRPIQGTHLSPPTFTDYTSAWVLVIATPIYERPEKDTVLGVLGLMLKLGSFVEVPGNALPSNAASGAEPQKSRFAVLLDTREDHIGQILQHPRYAELKDDRPALNSLLTASQDQGRRVVGQWQWHDNYRDPLAELGSPAAGERWLAARLPVHTRSGQSGLDVIVQENYDQAIGHPLAELRRGLILLSLITFGLSAAVIVPLWIVILRLVR